MRLPSLRKHALGLVAACALPGAAAAQAAPDVAQRCNPNGYVLTASAGPLAGGAAYLGKSCDAYSEVLGREGRWCWANGGVSVQFGDEPLIFSGLELTCEHPALSGLECSCLDTPLPAWR